MKVEITPPRNPTDDRVFESEESYALAFALHRSFGGTMNWGDPKRLMVANGASARKPR